MPHLYQEIAESLRRQIAAGDLQPGQRLPPVRDMAEQWGCTPGTVNRAYGQLAQDGLISSHRGGGTHVIDNPLAGDRPSLDWANLVNKAESFLLDALGGGHTAPETQAALSLAISRWETIQARPQAGSSLPPRPSAVFRFAGSHDLAVELLVRLLAEAEPDLQLKIAFVGSLGGLIALARGEAEFAGIHLWDAGTASYNLAYVHRVLPGRRLALVTLAYRALGFIVPPGNPQSLKSPADLLQPGLRWINRQSGSGTRVWLDNRLRQAGVDPAAIAGYDREAAGHMAVAQAVHDGSAAAGLGIQAAAGAYGLDFVPLTEELYQLVVPESSWPSPHWQSLLALIGSKAFKEAAGQLGGYDTRETAAVAWIQ